jgi:hypothetical protein
MTDERPDPRMLTREQAEARQRAYEAQRRAWRVQHPLKPARPFREEGP